MFQSQNVVVPRNPNQLPQVGKREAPHDEAASSSVWSQNPAAAAAPPAPPPTAPAKERYTRLEKIGEGTYGVVFKCEDQTTGDLVAIKRIALEADDEGVPSTAIREISLLRDVSHPHVVRLLDVVCQEKRLFLVFEFLEKDLKKMLDMRTTPLVGRRLKRLVWQLLDGIHACHSRRIVHRDLKPQNILVSRDDAVVKIADFGLARAFRIPLETYTHEVVTLWYRAPEILLGERHYQPAVDIWSIGCILAEMSTGRPLFAGDCEIHQLYTIFRALGTPNEAAWPGVSQLPLYQPQFPQWRASAPGSLADLVSTIDPEGFDLLSKMLTYAPEQRISAFEAMQHPWFRELQLSS